MRSRKPGPRDSVCGTRNKKHVGATSANRGAHLETIKVLVDLCQAVAMLGPGVPEATLKAGEQKTDLNVIIQRGAVIVRRLLDEKGEPIANLASPISGARRRRDRRFNWRLTFRAQLRSRTRCQSPLPRARRRETSPSG